MRRTPLLAALEYAGRGWAVFPCHEPTSSGCSCRQSGCASPAKHPRTTRGLHHATTDLATIRRWWHRWPNANVAVRTGSISGIVVLDVDLRHDGLKVLHELQRQHGPLPPSCAVRTGSGGRHYWFAHPGGVVRNSAARIGPGLDIRGDGGYVIAPPSRHRSGGQYLWASEVPLAAPPDWLLSRSQEAQPRPPTPTAECRPEPGSTAWARAALEGELRRVRAAPQGIRNHTLNRAAFSLGQLVGAGHLRPEVVQGALMTAGVGIGLTSRETRATITSGLRAGSRSPRSPSRRVQHTVGVDGASADPDAQV